MNDTFGEAIDRLGADGPDLSRERYFIITEIGKDNNRGSWHYDKAAGKFINRLPFLQGLKA